MRRVDSKRSGQSSACVHVCYAASKLVDNKATGQHYMLVLLCHPLTVLLRNTANSSTRSLLEIRQKEPYKQYSVG